MPVSKLKNLVHRRLSTVVKIMFNDKRSSNVVAAKCHICQWLIISVLKCRNLYYNQYSSWLAIKVIRSNSPEYMIYLSSPVTENMESLMWLLGLLGDITCCYAYGYL